MKSRQQIKPSYKCDWLEFLSKNIVKLFSCCKFKDREWHYLKAKDRLDRELDIECFIKNVRLLKNAFKFLTTRRERYLVRMQADKNVIIVREEDKKDLVKKLTTKQTLHGDSSEFESDQHEKYLKVLQEGFDSSKITLTERERHLIEGIKIQHTKKQEMRASVFKALSKRTSFKPLKEHI